MWFRGNLKKMADYPLIVVGGVTLKVVDKQKYLGVIFDPGLINSPMFVKRWQLSSPYQFSQTYSEYSFAQTFNRFSCFLSLVLCSTCVGSLFDSTIITMYDTSPE